MLRSSDRTLPLRYAHQGRFAKWQERARTRLGVRWIVPQKEKARTRKVRAGIGRKAAQLITVSVTVVVWDVEPLFPVTVMVWFPVDARLPTVIFIVELPAPVMEDGVKDTEF